MAPPNDLVMRTILVATSKRDKTKYPHPSDFTYELPITLNNVVGMAIRDYKFVNEALINENNKSLTINIDNGAVDGDITLDTGNYDNNISTLLSAINSKIAAYDIQFTLDQNVNRVTLAFTGSFVTSDVILSPSPILRILGYDGGVAMYRTTAPSLPSGVKSYLTTATAENKYDTWNLSELVLRITDVETILSNDAVTNRCTAVLFNTGSANFSTKQCLDHYIPLLQQQHRIQALRIKLLNMDGDLYDTINHDACFLIEFYCRPGSIENPMS